MNHPAPADALRVLAADMVERAASGHPGAPLGLADVAWVLWREFLSYNPNNPAWPNRDRFVLSNGHACALLYAVLHLTGYPLTLDDLRQFRQLGSKTPGHPEYGLTPGVEATTGPLGQGLANAVGMAVAERQLAARFNRPGHAVIDHFTYVLLGDGCMMEGISHEAASLAGTWKLGRLIALYDDNGISIDGPVAAWFSDDTSGRFNAYGWQVLEADGHDLEALRTALKAALEETDRPTLIRCRTRIGFAAGDKEGQASSHGSPLGEAALAALREALNWKHAPFEVPDDLRRQWDQREKGAAAEAEWQARYDAYRQAHPELAAELTRCLEHRLPDDWAARCAAQIQAYSAPDRKPEATRKTSQQVLGELVEQLPELTGGSADLAESNMTLHAAAVPRTPDGAGNYLYFGVREFAMTAIVNGLCLHGGVRGFAATFLVFSDYARNAIRMAALMRQPMIFVLSHDSIGLGEDGPTHQPIEHLASLRLIPNLVLWRPCDALEVAVAWQQAVAAADHPVALVFSRQSLPAQPRDDDQIKQIERGGYVLRDCKNPAAVLMATGSEVSIAMEVAGQLTDTPLRVVSMPALETFAAQSADYRAEVLPDHLPRISLEAGSTRLWRGWVGDRGLVLGIDRFGESAPAQDLFKHFDLTAEAVAKQVQAHLENLAND